MAYYGPPKSPKAVAPSPSQGQRHDRIDGDDADSGTAYSGSAAVETTITQKMMSAVSGSVLTSLLVTPLDVVRVRLQAQSGPSPVSSTEFVRLPPNLGVSACCREVFWVQNQSQFCVASPTVAIEESLISECAAEETQRRTFNSTLDGLRKIARNEGLTTLWRGLSPTLAMAVPANVIYFAGYDWMRSNNKSLIKGHVPDAYAPLVAGSVARILSALAVSPIEMLRTRMQASHPSTTTTSVLRETIAGLQEMVGTDGYRSLWRGLSLTLWRDVPFSAFYWWGYEYGREALHDLRDRSNGHDLVRNETAKRRRRSLSNLDHQTVLIDSFIAGAGSGAIAALATTPFDVGKTRQQTVRHKPKGAAGALDSARGTIPEVRPEDRSMPRFIWHIFKTEGTAGLFKGWAARCMKVAPACAIMISTYEIGKKMAHGRNEVEELVVQD